MIRSLLLAMFLAGPLFAQSPLPFAMGGPFTLVDQHGVTRTQTDPHGRAQLLFFGYANCPGICSAALPAMAEVTDLLADAGTQIVPILITIDPARDSVGTMGAPLSQLHEDFVGLTGSQAALDQAWKAFSVEHELAYVDPDYGAVYSHGSLIYLLDGAGKVLTILPPVLGPDEMARIAGGYLHP